MKSKIAKLHKREEKLHEVAERAMKKDEKVHAKIERAEHKQDKKLKMPKVVAVKVKPIKVAIPKLSKPKHHKKPKNENKKVARVMEEFKEHALHSGSKKGPKVTNRKQAIAIALSEARKAGEHVKPMKRKKK